MSNNIGLSFVPGHCDKSYHMFHLLIHSLEKQTAFINYLKENGITSIFHYVPVYLSIMGIKYGGKVGAYPIKEDFSSRIVLFPFFSSLECHDLDHIINTIKNN